VSLNSCKNRNIYKERNVSMLTYDLLLDWVNEAAGKAKAANPKIEIGICGEVDYTDGQIQRLTNIDYLSVSPDRFVYTRVQSARNH
jgi:hypothetical protein